MENQTYRVTITKAGYVESFNGLDAIMQALKDDPFAGKVTIVAQPMAQRYYERDFMPRAIKTQ